MAIEYFNNCTNSSREYMIKVLDVTCILDVITIILNGSGKSTINSEVLETIFNFFYNMIVTH